MVDHGHGDGGLPKVGTFVRTIPRSDLVAPDAEMHMDTRSPASRTVAVTTYRRANGSQARVVRPRVVRAPKVFPLAHTPAPAARRRANDERARQSGRPIPGVTGATEDTL